MEKFKKWFKSQEERELTPHEWVQEAWQEATRQRDAQYELMAEHTELSIREDAVVGERKRTMRVLNNILLAHEGITLTKGVIATLINIIEKESE